MPVLESADHIVPRSILPHRPITDDGKKPGKKNTTESTIIPVARRASRLQPKQTEEGEPEKNKEPQEDGENDNTDHDDEVVEVWTQDATDAGETKRARATAGKPASPTGPKKLPKMPSPTAPTRKGVSLRRSLNLRAHPLLLLGIGMIVMLVLWTLLTLAANWWNTTWNDIHYGRPRTFQVDAVVGHNDSTSNPSHFIALNLNGRIEVIEFPGGDASKARIYIGPQLYGNGQELIPVMISFVDVNGNHHPDMIIHFQDTNIVYINDQGGFRPANANEIQAVQQYLQKHGE
ncbi:MAG TPA: hypothetical protein VIZ18_18510, partial [Ktedonobacteraceae bacterium]